MGLAGLNGTSSKATTTPFKKRTAYGSRLLHYLKDYHLHAIHSRSMVLYNSEFDDFMVEKSLCHLDL